MKRLLRRCKYNLTPELVEEILLRLPARSLVRFKRVCKLWNSLISDQRFVDSHLRLHSNKSSSEVHLVLGWTRPLTGSHEGDDRLLDIRQTLSLLTINDSDDTGCSDSEDDCINNCNMRDILLPLRPDIFQDHDEDMEGSLNNLRGFHCNGILCLVDTSPFFNERVAFYNPALRQCKFLRTSVSLPDFFFAACGFGYDSKANVYKLVRILAPDFISSVSKAEVYTLGTNSCKLIRLDMNCRLDRNGGAYLKGSFYWPSEENGNERILSFDMSEDKFSSFSVPDIVDRDRRNWKNLVVWNDSLVHFNSPENGIFEMWVMGNNSNSHGDVVWTKHLTIGPIVCIQKLLTFWKNDELLMESKDGRMMSYNTSTKQLKELFLDERMLPGSTYASLYIESLVSVLSN